MDVGVVRGTAFDGKIDLRLTLFSTEFKWVSVALLYKRDMLDEWRSDAAIVSSNARFRISNEMHGLPCSETGSESRLTWAHGANDIATGSRCIVKAVVIPSVVVSCATDEFSRFETLFKGGDRIIGRGIFGDAVGTDSSGNAVVIEDHFASIVDPATGEILVSSEPMTNPVSAVGTELGGMVVLDSDGTITEIDGNGDTVYTLDASAMATGEYATLSRHPATGNLLVSGGAVNAVSELAWGGPGHGTTLWNYTDPSLSLPTGASYGDGLEVVIFCDSGNNRIIIIDRSFSPESVSTVSSITIDGQILQLRQPVRCSMSNGVIYACEGQGRPEIFGETASLHPAMARIGMGTATGSNAIRQFSGMCFVPISRSVK